MLAQKQKELEENKTRYEMLFADCNHHKAKSISLQHSLEEALSELRFARQSQFLIEENRKDLPMDIVHKYKQLRAQFEEKIKVLNSTRSDLFALQTDLFALQKNQEIEALEEEPLFEKLHHLLEENQALEEEIEALEQVTTTFLTKKSSTRTKKAQKLDKMLELQFDME